jgi:hypothetical protein
MPKSTKTDHKKVENKHTEIGSLKQKEYRSRPVSCELTLGLHFPFNSKRVLELIPMAITLGGFGSVTNDTTTFCPVAKCVILWPTSMFTVRKGHTSGGPEHFRVAEYPLYGGSGKALWNEAGVRGFTVLITCNFEPE